MLQENVKFVVEMDPDTYSVLEEFCEQMNKEDQKVVNYLMKQTLKDFITGYNELKRGYVECGKMNLEICNDFTVTENEAYSHIEGY